MEMDQLCLERETTDPDPDMWRWSPLELTEFDRMLTVAVQLLSRGLRQLFFAEAGCGIGTKLYLAKHYHNLHETGYEISREYLVKAGELGVNAYRWDLREKHPPWSHFNIVYIARPFKDDAVEVAWENEVCESMRPGSVLISAYSAHKPYSWPCFYRRPFRGVWMKPRAASYTQMIRRTEPTDPLVGEPGPRGLPGAVRRALRPSPSPSGPSRGRFAEPGGEPISRLGRAPHSDGSGAHRGYSRAIGTETTGQLVRSWLRGSIMPRNWVGLGG
jgi:hypothetical protein